MKLLFLISGSGGHAVGGHYNSLNQVSLEMAKNNEVKILMIGKVLSPIIRENPYFVKHIIAGHSLADIFRLNREFKSFFKTFKPDLIHCFDTSALNRVLLSKATKNIPVVLNKCGGQSPRRNNYFHADAIVVFSSENQEWYFNSMNFNNESIFLIPNRVRPLKLLPEDLKKEKANPKKITFVRISRLGGSYEMTLLQTFNLLEELHKTIEVELFVVGRVQIEERFRKLVEVGEQKNFSITYITDERAAKASDFLYLADFAVGTGRSFMEATSLGIPTLTPVKNSNIPILVNAKNVEQFLATNFSERNVAKNDDKKVTIDTIKNIVINGKSYSKYQIETKSFFEEYFGTKKINAKYTKVYNYAITNSSSHYKLLFKNFLYTIRFLLQGS